MSTLNGIAPTAQPIGQVLSPQAVAQPRGTLPGHKGFVNIASDDRRLFNHRTLDDARKEAERLAAERGLTVIVYQPTLVVTPPQPRPPRVEFINERAFNTNVMDEDAIF